MAKVKVKFKVESKTTPEGKALESTVKALKKKPFVKEGYPAESGKTNAKHNNSGPTVLFIAVVHEFGTEDGRIPERSHLRASFQKNVKQLEAFSQKELSVILDGKRDVKAALARIGLFMLNNHKSFIKAGIKPDLSDSTKAQRAKLGDTSPTPLIDTAQLLNSATIKVIMDGR